MREPRGKYGILNLSVASQVSYIQERRQMLATEDKSPPLCSIIHSYIWSIYQWLQAGDQDKILFAQTWVETFAQTWAAQAWVMVRGGHIGTRQVHVPRHGQWCAMDTPAQDSNICPDMGIGARWTHQAQDVTMAITRHSTFEVVSIRHPSIRYDSLLSF